MQFTRLDQSSEKNRRPDQRLKSIHELHETCRLRPTIVSAVQKISGFGLSLV